MARLITSQLLTMPTGLQADYLNDYKNQSSYGGKSLSAIGEGLSGISKAMLDYEDRQNKEEQKQYERNLYATEKAEKAQKEADEKALAEAKKQDRAAKATDWYNKSSGKEREFLDSALGQYALKQYIDNGDNSIVQARQVYDLEETNRINRANAEADKAKAEAEKAAEDAKKAAKEADEGNLRQAYDKATIDGLTDPQIGAWTEEQRNAKLAELSELYKQASAMGLETLCNNLNSQMRRVQAIYEKKAAAKPVQQRGATIHIFGNPQ